MGKRALGFALLFGLVFGAGKVRGYDDATNPLAPATNQVQARFGVIQQEITRLQGIGDAAGAAAMQASLQHFQDELVGTAPTAVAGPELDVVGLYGGVTVPGKPQLPGTASVSVGQSDRPIILALGGYDPINWSLQLGQGAQLQQIIVSNSGQVVLNAPAGVPIISAQISWFDEGKDWYEFPAGARKLYSMTGLPISSFQGYVDPQPQSYQIGLGNPDWRAQRILREMDGLYSQATAYQRSQAIALASNYQFTAVVHDWNDSSTSRLGLMTPVKLSQIFSPALSENLLHVAVDPSGPTYYGLLSGSMVRVNPATGDLTNIPLPNEEYYLDGMAFDSTRNRVVVTTFEGEGRMYAYTPSTQQWSFISDLNNEDLKNLAYFAPQDCFYGLDIQWGGTPSRLVKFGSDGTFLGDISLSEHMPPGNPGEFMGFEMIAVGNYLALVTPPVADLNAPELAPQMRGFLIDPITGDVVYSGVFIPEPGAISLMAISIGILMTARNGRCRIQSTGP